MTTLAEPATTPALPPAKAWHTASHDRDCPACRRLIKKGELVAHADDADGGRHVCGNCTSSPRPRRTR